MLNTQPNLFRTYSLVSDLILRIITSLCFVVFSKSDKSFRSEAAPRAFSGEIIALWSFERTGDHEKSPPITFQYFEIAIMPCHTGKPTSIFALVASTCFYLPRTCNRFNV